MLHHVAILCSGDLDEELFTNTTTTLTSIEEWLFYFTFTYGQAVKWLDDASKMFWVEKQYKISSPQIEKSGFGSLSAFGSLGEERITGRRSWDSNLKLLSCGATSITTKTPKGTKTPKDTLFYGRGGECFFWGHRGYGPKCTKKQDHSTTVHSHDQHLLCAVLFLIHYPLGIGISRQNQFSWQTGKILFKITVLLLEKVASIIYDRDVRDAKEKLQQRPPQ